MEHRTDILSSNWCPSTQEVTSSSLVPPIFAPILSGEPGLRKLLEALLGLEGRRRSELRNKTNDKLFTLYDADLVLRVRNARNLDKDIN